ncbi:EamA/RhaT family transporter [Serratia sp. S1B]|nr:EamA/RhaT family transporter [Serratia sp. S1B]
MAYLLLTLAGVFWGGNYVIGHVLVQYINPYGLSLIRWSGTSLIMFTLYWQTIKHDLPSLRKNLGYNTIFSLLGQVIFPLSLYIGLQYTSSLNAAIYISSTPCLVLMINHFIFKEIISKRNIIGVITSTIGVIYLAFSNSKGTDSLSRFGLGDILTIISALSWALYCSLLRVKDKNVKNTSFVAFNSLIGTLILIPIYLIHGLFSNNYSIEVSHITTFAIAGMIYLIVFPSWLAYVFWSKGVSLIGTTRSEIFTHVIPLSGGLMGIIFLGEEFKLYHLITLTLIVFGIICCSTKKVVSNQHAVE